MNAFGAALLLMLFCSAALLTQLVRRYTLRHAVLDIPNERSSHTAPTPRGGGLAIVAAVLGGLLMGWLLDYIPSRLFVALAGGGSLVAAVGWIDDHRAVHAIQRSLVHVIAAIWALTWLGGLPKLHVGTALIPLGVSGWVLGTLGIVWFINLYNFMDGIDGLAAGEAVSVGGAGAILAALAATPGIALASGIIAVGALGFLVWNWHPARIFMGDVGSGFLGFCFVVLAIASERTGGPQLLLWMLLLGVFVLDATLTLVRRAARGEQWFAAHRLHSYQRAVQAGASHARVSASVLLMNLVLFSLAGAALLRPALTMPAIAAGLAVVAAAYLWIEGRQPM
jgi:Fuc2NAc and GlcNAc transferase